jgi:hypothetical protein
MKNIFIARELLLVEIERRCGVDADCNARTRVGLTKEEARAYCGFTCERCERWNGDVLTERDVPEWWEELALTSLDGLRQLRSTVAAEPGEVVKRMSDNYRAEQKDHGPELREDDGPELREAAPSEADD